MCVCSRVVVYLGGSPEALYSEDVKGFQVWVCMRLWVHYLVCIHVYLCVNVCVCV